MNMLAQLDPVSAKVITEGADFLASKDLRWLFFAIGIAFLLFVLGVIKFLLSQHQRYLASRDAHEKELTDQLTQQRTNAGQIQEKLLAYITGDHIQCVSAQAKVSDILMSQTKALERLTESIENLGKRNRNP